MTPLSSLRTASSLLLIGALMLTFVPRARAQSPGDYAQLKTQAEKEYREKSFSRAYAVYLKANDLPLDQGDKAWVRFRLADSLWRSQGGDNPDSEKLEKAREDLEAQAREKRNEDERDALWAEAQESLGDYYWERRNSRDWSSAWQHYQQALDWWAGARDLEQARARYLAIVWRCARPAHEDSEYAYGYYGNYLPQEILENVLKIVKTPEDETHAHYLMALSLFRQGSRYDLWERLSREFEAALKLGKRSEWYGDALFNYAQWLGSVGKRQRLPNGQWQQGPDFAKALDMYRRILKEFKKGETRYYDQAQEQIAAITASTLEIQVANIFLPDSEIQAYLNWRNQERIDLAIYAVDLTQAVALSKKQSNSEFLQSVKVSELKKVKAWTKIIEKGEYLPGSETLRLDSKLGCGAYIIEAKGRGVSSRDLILVTDATMVLKTSGRRVLAFFCNVQDGTPIPGAGVRLWSRKYDSNSNEWRTSVKQTNRDGLALFERLEPGAARMKFWSRPGPTPCRLLPPAPPISTVPKATRIGASTSSRTARPTAPGIRCNGKCWAAPIRPGTTLRRPTRPWNMKSRIRTAPKSRPTNSS